MLETGKQIVTRIVLFAGVVIVVIIFGFIITKGRN